MPKFPTFPTLYDECKSLEVSFLKKHGYLKPDGWKSGTVTWSRGEGSAKQVTGSIGIRVSLSDRESYLELDYQSDGKPVKYKVPLVAKPANIGKGQVWFFRCPQTGRLCRKLHLIGGYFLHRSAFKGAMYEKQTYSASKRNHWRQWEKLFGTDKVQAELYGRHFKTTYRGKPTKRYLKLLQKLKRAEGVTEESLLNYLRS